MRFILPLVISVVMFQCGPTFANSPEEDFDLGYDAFVDRDFSAAAQYWESAGFKGHVRAQNGLGVLYRDGDLGEPDPEAAQIWFLKAARQGYAYAMFNLGMLQKSGSTKDSSDISAYMWLLLASTINFDENATFQADLLSKRMSRQELAEAQAKAQDWIDVFFFGMSSIN